MKNENGYHAKNEFEKKMDWSMINENFNIFLYYKIENESIDKMIPKRLPHCNIFFIYTAFKNWFTCSYCITSWQS